jgi:hypothetical protein
MGWSVFDGTVCFGITASSIQHHSQQGTLTHTCLLHCTHAHINTKTNQQNDRPGAIEGHIVPAFFEQ